MKTEFENVRFLQYKDIGYFAISTSSDEMIGEIVKYHFTDADQWRYEPKSEIIWLDMAILHDITAFLEQLNEAAL